MKRELLISSALIIAIGASAAFASGDGYQGRKGMHGPRINFEEVDTNKDGKITKDEMAAHAEARFKASDTDGNGSLSTAEIEAHMKAKASERAQKWAGRMSSKMIERHDANGDGEVSMAEMKPKHEGKMFTRLDSDNDGAISADEFAAAKGKHRGWGRDKD